MELVKIIIIDLQDYLELIIKRFNLQKIENDKWIIIHEWNRKSEEWNEKIVLILCWLWKENIKKNMEYILENYIPNKIINLWLSNILNNIDLKWWDIIIPNTFIHSNLEWNGIFLENVSWNNYDLNNFWLIMNWICLSNQESFIEYKKSTDFTINNWIDIYDNSAFFILSIAQEKELLENCLVIKWVVELPDNWFKNSVIENSVNILELVI